MYCIVSRFESAFKNNNKMSLMMIRESANCLTVASAVPIIVFLWPYLKKLDKNRVADVNKTKMLSEVCCISTCIRQEGVKMEMLVLLLADRVVRVTGLLIWQVTWEPGERLQRGSALSITTFLILTRTDKGGVYFV